MNRNLNRRIHPIAEADGLSPKKPRNGCIAWDRVPNTPIYTDLEKANFAFSDILIKEHQV